MKKPRGPARVRISVDERRPFTPDRVRKAISDAIIDRTRQGYELTDDAIDRVARVWSDLQVMYATQVSATWTTNNDLAEQLADALEAVARSVPALIASLERAGAYALENGKPAMTVEAGRRIAILDKLASSASAAGSLSLVRNARDRPRELRWEHYADKILSSVEREMPLKKQERYRLLVHVIADVTGEGTTHMAIETAFRDGKVPAWPEPTPLTG